MSTNTIKKAAIMQPTYFPWLGYFDLIDQVDTFIFLDDVQFEKQSWQQRNQIRTAKQLEWITVPVRIKGRFGQLIKEVQINPVKFPVKHFKLLKQNYSRASYFEHYYNDIQHVIQEACLSQFLSNLNIEVIKWICLKLGIKTKFFKSSDIGVKGKKSERIVNLLKELEISTYISPKGSLGYIKEEYTWFKENRIAVYFTNYDHPEYRQVYSPFIPYASVVDLLFNEGGGNSLNIIRSGRCELIPMEKAGP